MSQRRDRAYGKGSCPCLEGQERLEREETRERSLVGWWWGEEGSRWGSSTWKVPESSWNVCYPKNGDKTHRTRAQGACHTHEHFCIVEKQDQTREGEAEWKVVMQDFDSGLYKEEELWIYWGLEVYMNQFKIILLSVSFILKCTISKYFSSQVF